MSKTRIVYAVGPSDDGKTIVEATVVAPHYGRLPIEITSRRGETLFVSHDALETLIIALQQVQSQIRNGLIVSNI